MLCSTKNSICPAVKSTHSLFSSVLHYLLIVSSIHFNRLKCCIIHLQTKLNIAIYRRCFFIHLSWSRMGTNTRFPAKTKSRTPTNDDPQGSSPSPTLFFIPPSRKCVPVIKWYLTAPGRAKSAFIHWRRKSGE